MPEISLIELRRTTRRFDPDRPIDPALLERVLTLATLAPSPMNLQPWRFLVVRDPRNLWKLRGCTFGEARITDTPAVVIVLADVMPARSSLAEVVDQMLLQSAITPEDAARLRASATRDWERGDRGRRAERSAMLAAGTLLLAAETHGLASAWLEGFDEEQVREAFGIPDDHIVAGLLALGYSAEAAPFPGRLGLESVAFAEHFGLPWPGE